MKRQVIRVFGASTLSEVGNGFCQWNSAIGAMTGQIVPCRDGKHELWCDEEALCNNPVMNFMATALAGQPIFGDVILFKVGDIK